MKTLKFKINDLNQTVNLLNNKFNPTILDFCIESGIYIPHFCYNKYLTIAGNCRVCIIEIAKFIKPIISCLNLCIDNLNVYTNSYSVKKFRENVLEFLLVNHPLDCPICDQAGECDLQEHSLNYGSDRSRFFFKKKTNVNIYLNNYIKLNLNRCILCLRCVRFFREISTSNIFLGTIGRGSFSKIHLYNSVKLLSFESSNIIDICPVGALNSKYNQFTYRPWELESKICVDVFDSFGLPVSVEFKFKEVVRVLPYLDNIFFLDFISDKTRSCLGLYDDFFNYVFDPMKYDFIYRFTVEKTFSIINYPMFPLRCFKHANLSFRLTSTKQKRFVSVVSTYFNFINNYLFKYNINILYQNVISFKESLKKYMYRFFLHLTEINKKFNNLILYNGEDLNILNINTLLNKNNIFFVDSFVNKFNYFNSIYLIKYLSFFKTLLHIDDMYFYSLKNINIWVKFPFNFIDFKHLSRHTLTKNRGIGHVYRTRILKFDKTYLYNLMGNYAFSEESLSKNSLVPYTSLCIFYFNYKIFNFKNVIKY